MASASTPPNGLPDQAQPGDERAERLRRLAEEPEVGLLGELWEFLRENKKWWLGPIIAVLLVVSVLLLLATSSLAPFIYPLF